MNKIDYPENIGKIFFRNLEIIHMTEGLDEAFAGLLSAFSHPTDKKKGIKLSGCEVTMNGSNYSVTPGFAYLAGEVCKVNAQSIVAGVGETVYFDVLQTDYDSNWPAPIEGGTSYQTRKQRVVKLVKSATPPNDRMDVNAATLEKKVMDAAHPAGHPVFFDPRLEGKVLGDYFNQLGEGLLGKRYEGWIVLGVYAGTEPYRGRAIVNMDSNDIDLNDVGNVYGAKEHKLVVAEMPEHSHQQDHFQFDSTVGSDAGGGSSRMNLNPFDTSKVGGDQAHNNMQPSIVAAFITRKSDNGFYA